MKREHSSAARLRRAALLHLFTTQLEMQYNQAPQPTTLSRIVRMPFSAFRVSGYRLGTIVEESGGNAIHMDSTAALLPDP